VDPDELADLLTDELRALATRTHRASGITMREAVRYLPAGQRDGLMLACRKRHAAN
jgi:predicted transcriptional regulator